MSLDEAKLLGSIADQYMDDETQEEVNVRSLMYYNEQELFDKISDVNLSKFELEFLYGRLINTTGTFWSLIFKETIKVFSLNTLKPLCKNDLSSTQTNIVKKVIFFLKIQLRDFFIENGVTESRSDFIGTVERLGGHNYIVFALQTMDNEDFRRLKMYFKRIASVSRLKENAVSQ